MALDGIRLGLTLHMSGTIARRTACPWAAPSASPTSARCSPAPFERSPPGTGHIFPTAALLWALAFPTALLVIAPP
ncbi:hypothetical protein ACFUJY_26750 [Streptomyces sp. NPDC057249]|uniref:hypothetical protein n=1 Tax=Streptomyces sp. NPDC057249 TaxID=3346067 RepID=UPI00363D20E6